VAKRQVIVTELGREIFRGRCQEFWPADSEFWYSGQTWCKACYREWKAKNKQKNSEKRKTEALRINA
jgi:hypothetical protein